MSETISGVLIDLGGVVFVGDRALPGAVEALEALRRSGLSFRFITNTTSTPLRALVAKLRRLGVEAEPDEVFTPAAAARQVLRARGLVPHLLVHPDLREDFEPAAGAPDAVVVGDAGPGFTYAALNAAFRRIDAGAAFLALARNRTFRDADGGLSLDAGPFVAALEHAARREAELIGKPAPAFFAAACAALGVPAGETAMIGDDAESDVAGARALGLAGLLVRTGKYRAGDEAGIDPGPTAVLDDLRAAVDWALARR